MFAVYSFPKVKEPFVFIVGEVLIIFRGFVLGL